MAGSDPFLFVSHVGEDGPAAMEIVAELERRGIRCWITPRDVRGGRAYDDEISDAIDASRAMLLIFSEHCNDNQYIRREVTVAGESQKIIIPFRIEDAQPRRGLRIRLADLHWIDGFVARERALDELARALPPTQDGKAKLPRDGEEGEQRARQEVERLHREEERCRLEEAAQPQRQEQERSRNEEPPQQRGVTGRSIKWRIPIVLCGILGAAILGAVLFTASIREHAASSEKSAHQSIERLASMLDIYKLDVGSYPTTQQGLAALIARPTGVTRWNGPYLKGDKVPEDPWGRPFVYHNPSLRVGHEYDLYSVGPTNQWSSTIFNE